MTRGEIGSATVEQVACCRLDCQSLPPLLVGTANTQRRPVLGVLEFLPDPQPA